jgi:HEAT repeat protein
MGQAHLLALGVLAGVTAAVGGQERAEPADPIRSLEALLQDSSGDAQGRDSQTRACLRALQTPADFYRAWRLPAWHEPRPGDPLGAIDQANRAAVAQQFLAAMHRALAGPDPEAVAQWCACLGQWAEAERGEGRRPVLPRQLAADLAALTVRGRPQVRREAARALGHVEPDPRLAIPALEALLVDPEPGLRVAAADGLAALLPALLQSSVWDAIGDGAQQVRDDLAQTALRVLPAVARGLVDAEPGVRRRCAGTVGRAAVALDRLATALPAADLLTDSPAGRGHALQQLEPLAEALGRQGPCLARAAGDADAGVRLLAQKAVEELAQAHTRWLREASRLGPDAGQVRRDLLRPALAVALPAVAAASGDPDVKVRRAALDALEALGSAAAPAVPALTHALRDTDRSVRWSAVRILGALGQPSARPALGELTRLLADPDPDMRLAAVNALPRIAAGDAVDLLRRALGDSSPEVRRAAQAALLQISAPPP